MHEGRQGDRLVGFPQGKGEAVSVVEHEDAVVHALGGLGVEPEVALVEAARPFLVLHCERQVRHWANLGGRPGTPFLAVDRKHGQSGRLVAVLRVLGSARGPSAPSSRTRAPAADPHPPETRPVLVVDVDKHGHVGTLSRVLDAPERAGALRLLVHRGVERPKTMATRGRCGRPSASSVARRAARERATSSASCLIPRA